MKSILSRLVVLAGTTVVCGANAEPAQLSAPYEGVYQPRGVDEVGLWHEDDESEQQLAASNLLVRDEKLTAYVKKILCDTVGEDRCKATRIYIIREPSFNASMSPNGTMRVLSGLFLRVHSEAELGSVLGHEFGHFERRHTLEHFKSARSGTDLLAWAAVLASLSATYNAQNSYQNIQYSIYGNLYRNGRNQEREADLLGIGYLNKSSLRPQAAAAVWVNVMGELEASSTVKGLKKPNFNSIAFTASHPPNAERAGYLAQFAIPEGATRDDGAERYRSALADWMPVLLKDQIKLNDFGASDYLINALAADGWTAWLWNARGDLFRTRGNPRDLVNAAEFYSKAIELDPTMADAHRGLGLALIKTGHQTEGRNALRTYLNLKKDAPDAGMIRMLVSKEVTTK